LEYPADDLLDFSGWELRKALLIFRKSNPPLLNDSKALSPTLSGSAPQSGLGMPTSVLPMLKKARPDVSNEQCARRREKQGCA
jgi:hypothetical protein